MAGWSAERTLILPGDVRYELDLAQLRPGGCALGRGQQHAQRHACPKSRSPGPKSIWRAAREYGEDGVLGAVTDADRALDRNNRARAVADLRKQAARRSADAAGARSGRQAVERSFALPLQAAGFDNAKVVARFATEGSPVTVPTLTGAAAITMCWKRRSDRRAAGLKDK